VPPQSTLRALDVACGAGRHVQLALERGYWVTGIDRDVSRVTAVPPPLGSRLELIAADLEDGSAWPVVGRTFDAVIVTDYLHRRRLADIVAAVAADGVLIYETFAAGQARFGKPSNPAFLLNPGELLGAVADTLVPFAYEHVRLAGPRIVQRIVAVGPRHHWLGEPPLRG
jgi:SAM-dependent methyltransferase